MPLNVTAAVAGVTPSFTVPVEKVLPVTDCESVKNAPVTSDVRPASATASTTRPMTRRRRSPRAAGAGVRGAEDMRSLPGGGGRAGGGFPPAHGHRASGRPPGDFVQARCRDPWVHPEPRPA